jgi:hypothetical protein
VGGWAAASVARWPKFRPKSSKGAEEKKSWLEEFVAEFWPNFAEKGPKKFLERISFLAELFSSTGHKIFSGPGNTGSSIPYTRQQLSAVRFISQIRKDNLCLPF